MTAPSHPKPERPYWLMALVAAAIVLFGMALADNVYSQALATLSKGIGITLFVTVMGFSLASCLGLLVALAGLSSHIVPRQLARLYVELVRGVPIIVLLLYVAFVLAPGGVLLWNWVAGGLGLAPVRARDFPFLWRAIIALCVAYAAFLAEIFRAGILSVDAGQIEASKALGLSGYRRFRHVVFPQAFRTILPSYANDFVAMVKDSSLVSVLGVADVTQLGKVTAAGNFRYFETYNLVALIYLTMTITLSLALRKLEVRLRARQSHAEG